MFVIKKKDDFQAYLSYRRPHFGPLDDILKSGLRKKILGLRISDDLLADVAVLVS